MWKYISTLLAVTFLLCSCSDTGIERTIGSTTWQEIVDKEWSNFDSFPGDGFYFYEKDGRAYCTFFIYGSGVRLIHHYTSEVVIEEEGRINLSISLPKEYDEEQEKVYEVTLIYEDTQIEHDNRIYNVQFEGNSFEYID